MKLLEALKWRYATKKFDSSKKVNDSDIIKVKEAIHLSASSYGLQPYQVFIITNEDIRKKLKLHSWNQSQTVDASHLFVFCNYKEVSPPLVDAYIKLRSSTQSIDIEKLKGYGDFMKLKLSEKSEDQIKSWTAMQAYIALSNLLTCCAELKIDACPMEGFEPEKYDEILELPSKGLSACVIAAVGHRSEEDHTQFAKKVRKSNKNLFQEIK